MKLNLGCGKNIKPGYVNLDIAKLPGVDKIHDLDKYPYPFKDNAFDEIYCSHVLEHVTDLVKTMEELYRISSHRCKIIIEVPYFTSPGAFSDPTHKSFFTYNTMDYFSKRGGLSYYSKSNFRILRRKIRFFAGESMPVRFLSFFPDILINLFPMVYQRFFCYVFPASEINYILTPIK